MRNQPYCIFGPYIEFLPSIGLYIIEPRISLPEKPFFIFVGEKYCKTTILDPKQLKTVGVGLTFQPFVGTTFTSFVEPSKESKVSTTILRGQQF